MGAHRACLSQGLILVRIEQSLVWVPDVQWELSQLFPLPPGFSPDRELCPISLASLRGYEGMCEKIFVKCLYKTVL